MDLCHLKNLELDPQKILKTLKIQRQSRTPRWHCQRWFRFEWRIYWTRIISITNDSRKSHGHYIKSSKMFRTRSRCSIRWNSRQKGRCTDVIENSKVGMPRYLDTSTKTQMVIIMVQKRRPSCSYWSEICTVTFWEDDYGKGNLRKFYWNTDGEKFRIGNVWSLTEKKGYSYQCVWTISNWLARNKTSILLARFSWKTSIWENLHHFLTMFI